MNFIITGIGTGIGKTFCSAVICEALGLDYWKPIQSGELDNLDSDFVRNNTSERTIHPERFLLTEPLSPHESARIDGIELEIKDFAIPIFEKGTLIEGAGGLMVPLNDKNDVYLDVFMNWNLPLFVVTKHYLGSINHTLLTIETLLSKKLTIQSLVVNGERNEASERIYKTRFPQIKITYIPELENITKESIHKIAVEWKAQIG
ncbi:MAG: dethiobiotin synthase [Fluviicola sp.]